MIAEFNLTPYQLFVDLLGGAYFEDDDGFMAVIRLNLILNN
jgi:hypothetical protein